VVVLGGGAAGFFAAIRAAELGASVTILEAAARPLQKVLVSGGGRCNVTHALFDPARFVEHYPRGAKELRQAFARFQAKDTVAWFEARGVALKTEDDGRVFPVTDDAHTVADCLLREAERLGVGLRSGVRVEGLERVEGGFRLRLRSGDILASDRLLLATGSNPQGLAFAAQLGHTVEAPVPALFSLRVEDRRIEGLAGIAVADVRATLEVAKPAKDAEGAKPGGMLRVTKSGALLVTHQGFSAHAILRVSSWAARELAAAGYRARLTLDLVPALDDAALRAAAEVVRREHPKGTVGAHAFAPAVPRRLWERLVAAAGIDPATRWAEAPRKGLDALVGELKRGLYEVVGKGDFREEIVTCGGVRRKEVDWATMESRVCPGLHLAGEVLDVDGLTGGFNFQNAWTTGWIAGTAMAQ